MVVVAKPLVTCRCCFRKRVDHGVLLTVELSNTVWWKLFL